jgi:hypothetical protein
MTQYTESVKEQRIRYEAEQWSRGVQNIHAHSLSSMWYDTRPEDTEGGKSVTDITYNDGHVERTLSTGEKIILGERLTGQDLLDAYQKKT